jgi:hypothetical protein
MATVLGAAVLSRTGLQEVSTRLADNGPELDGEGEELKTSVPDVSFSVAGAGDCGQGVLYVTTRQAPNVAAAAAAVRDFPRLVLLCFAQSNGVVVSSQSQRGLCGTVLKDNGARHITRLDDG